MSKTVKLLFLVSAWLLLAGCGGGSGGSSGSAGVTVTPSGIQVLAGASQQMTATAADGGMAFTWQVNGITSGNSTIGTVSQSGLYTAPDLPPPGGKVTIMAIEQSNTSQSGTATLSIGYSDASLKGAYVFSMGGLSSGTPWNAIGEFSANGAGQISNGLQDINNGSSAQTKMPFNGTYNISPNGFGTITLGGINTQFVLLSGSDANFISTDNQTIASGNFAPQSQTAGSVSTLSGPYIFSLGSANSVNQPFAELGRFIASNGSLTNGTVDINGPNPLVNASLTGSYTFDGSNNHGTLTLIYNTNSYTYSFYVQDATDLIVLSSDSSLPISGSISAQQAMAFNNASFIGSYVLFAGGASPTQGFVQAGQFNPNGQGNLGNITEDINTPGDVVNITPPGTYALDAAGTGRGTLTINNQGQNAPQTYVFYMSSPTQAQIMTMNSSIVAAGFITSQPQGTAFSNSSLHAHYGFALISQASPTSLLLGLGILSADGQGNLTGNLIENLNGSVSNLLSLSGTYMLNSSVRGTATLISNGGGSSPFAIYPITPDGFVMIGTNASSPYLGLAIIQY